MCKLYEELKYIDKMMNVCSNFEEWEEMNHHADEICFKISECNVRCGNKVCKALQPRKGLGALFG